MTIFVYIVSTILKILNIDNNIDRLNRANMRKLLYFICDANNNVFIFPAHDLLWLIVSNEAAKMEHESIYIWNIMRFINDNNFIGKINIISKLISSVHLYSLNIYSFFLSVTFHCLYSYLFNLYNCYSPPVELVSSFENASTITK